jgi:hypothetical protein
VLLLGACGGSENRAGTGSEATDASPARESTTGEASAGEWIGRYALWADDLRTALIRVGTVLSDERSRKLVADGDNDTASAFADALARVQGCASFEDNVGDPPPKLTKAADLLEHACERFRAGAKGTPDAVENPALLAKVFDAWSEAANLVQSANASFPAPEPIETLPLPAIAGVADVSRFEPFFSRVADQLAAPDAEVRCWDGEDWQRLQKETFGKNLELAGFASFDVNGVNLAPEICDALALLAYTDERPTGDDQLAIAFAVVVLMHETGHLNRASDFYGAGENEPLAECWAMQHVRLAARTLRAGARYSDALAERYWHEVYPRVQRRYRSPKCRNDGEYDVRPSSDLWP